jgi:fructosamine-3-kinase
MIESHSIDWQGIATHISKASSQYFEIQTIYTITSGYNHSAFRIEGAGQNYFVKVNTRDCFDMFAAEAASLAEIWQTAIIRVPIPLCWGTTNGHAYLVMEYIALRSDYAQSASISLGQQLAVMHRVSRVPFGWHRHNYLGLNMQVNTLETDWVTFWQKHRLGSQLSLANRNGYGGELQQRGERLLADLGLFFSNYQPYSSLLHGDLWLGNYAMDMQGQPVIFDPAVYYGDRETDLAMTELFGGFSASFYAAYQERWPLDPGYSIRKNLYKLYHILNHLNSFGGTYLGQAERMIASLLSEL